MIITVVETIHHPLEIKHLLKGHLYLTGPCPSPQSLAELEKVGVQEGCQVGVMLGVLIYSDA
jgi:hypothetical protein